MDLATLVPLTDRELDALGDLIETRLSELSREIHRAETARCREELKERKAVLVGLLRKLINCGE